MFASALLIFEGRCFSSSSTVVHWVFSRKEPPFFRPPSTSYRLTYSCLWQAMKSAVSMRYVDLIGLWPKRRWETVMPPDFFESYAK
ncbi:MAG: hypothetical protein BWY99_01900 [Synergistetes bacterium ADurb.BinA166]|nr:MAG: hypothetical protein BWY99_01900 [Synergistetes bacterium ADurb.BinA166]